MDSEDFPTSTAGAERAGYRNQLAIADTFSRSATSGYLYLIGAVAAILASDMHAAYPVAAGALLASFLLLALVRQSMRPPAADGDGGAWVRRYTGVMALSALLWSGMQVWILLDDYFPEPVRTLSLFGTIAYATVFAHLYTTILRIAVAGIAAIFLPPLIVLWTMPDLHMLAAAFGLYGGYLVFAMLRSRRDYLKQLDLHEALREQRDRYARLSRTDALTGLANRRHFAAKLDAAIAQPGTDVALLLLDIDHFKAINDAHGHVAGDAALKAVAERLRIAFGNHDAVLARIGGEEFGVVLKGAVAAGALSQAERIRHALAGDPLICDGRSLPVTVSIGAGLYDPVRHADGDAFYRAVDLALYAAKARGRNRVQPAAGATGQETAAEGA